ncbi:MAG: hypothetical protein AMXMBFR53_07020 [Gemmatimonadota bacterium]
MEREEPRLFVALNTQPYEWFKSRAKSWELRRARRQFTTQHLRVGRRVELRAGYGRARPPLWGRIAAVHTAHSLEDFFSAVPFHLVIPSAPSVKSAIVSASQILGIEPLASVPLIGFRVTLDD